MAETEAIRGVLKRIDKQQIAVRTAERSYRPRHPEVLVLPELAHRYPLVEGASVTGQVEQRKGKPKLVSIETLGGLSPEAFAKRPRYSYLGAVDPYERFNLGIAGQESMRIVDLIAPIGKGSRQLIVSPPKAGKTVMLEQMAQAIHQCSPQTRIIVLLLDERPEEVTQFRRATEGAEIAASTSDRTADEHVELAELMLAHVQIELECGHDIVLMIDSLTRMGRAFNNRTRRGGGSRPTMSGGLEAGILEVPRRVFGLARRAEEGGSVTIVATCLVDTGSRMDQLIFEEFKGTGNSELILDRKLAEKRIFPAIDVQRSGTRREELLLEEPVLKMVWTMRRMLSAVGTNEGIELLLNRLSKTESNVQFLGTLTKSLDA